MTGAADADARRRIATEFGTTFFVEAAAGTGKTTALVGRIVGLLRSGEASLERIVAVTFTELAAGEMKLRLRGGIEEARRSAVAEERARLDLALEELEAARIGTIHSFCAELLRGRPVEARIDPLFTVAAEEEARSLVDKVFEQWFQRILADPPEGVRRVLRRRTGRTSPRDDLRSALHGLCQHRDYPTPWRRDAFSRDEAIDALLVQLSRLGALAAASPRPGDKLTAHLARVERFVDEATRLEPASSRDHDGLEAELRRFSRDWGWKDQGHAGNTFGGLARDDVLARRDAAKSSLEAFQRASDADLAPLLHEALRSAVAEYDAQKARTGQLDFLDLLVKTRDLLRDDVSVRADYQRRFSHYFVDEFQDTDPLQAEILLLLAADERTEADWRRVRPIPGKLFMVGDPKQSLYRFRRADIAIYHDLEARLRAHSAIVLHLTRSFRAPPSIQAFINGTFEPVMAGGAPGVQAAYVPLGPARGEVAGRPTIVALPVPAPYGDRGAITNKAIDHSYPDAVAAYVDWLLNESGWTVEEDGVPVALQPRHVTVLFRRFQTFGTDITGGYVRALESRRVPHVLVGGRSFHDREEIVALRNALLAIEWPDDELRVFATLRGPFFALGDDLLIAYRHAAEERGILRTRRLDPIRPLDRAQVPQAVFPVIDALDVLARLHRGRNDLPLAETVASLLDGTRAHAGLALWPSGEQALANCQRLIDIARRSERAASSFRGFIEGLEADAESGATADAPLVEDGADGVRLMTVHKAKGLEFPVVILADPTCKATHDNPGRHVDPERALWVETLCGSAPIELTDAADDELARDHAEAIRVAYVAATRARDLLVLPVCGDRPIPGWLGVFDPMLYPSDEARSSPADAPGCPPLGGSSVSHRGPKGGAPPGGAVRPGLHRSGAGAPPVVWWGPSALSLHVAIPAPLRQQHILQADPDGTAAALGEAAYAEWRRARETLLGRASKASIPVATVTTLARKRGSGLGAGATAAASRLGDVHIEFVDRASPDRPKGRRFGALVHSILAEIDLDADADAVVACAATNARVIGASDEERIAALGIVGSTLRHPVVRRAARSEHLRRETPVLHLQPDGGLLEGIVDLAFREEAPGGPEWTVVDFKTDREFAPAAAQYEEQVRLYAEAIRASTRLPCSGTVLVL